MDISAIVKRILSVMYVGHFRHMIVDCLGDERLAVRVRVEMTRLSDSYFHID